MIFRNGLVQKLSYSPVEDIFLLSEWYWKSTEYFGKFTGKYDKFHPGFPVKTLLPGLDFPVNLPKYSVDFQYHSLRKVFTRNPGWNLSQLNIIYKIHICTSKTTKTDQKSEIFSSHRQFVLESQVSCQNIYWKIQVK